jgi:uncharacterized protein (TIGR02246 family)
MEANEVQRLYEELLGAWNRRDAEGYARLFTDTATAVGFDGSLMKGRAEIGAALNQIFREHPTGRYVGIVKEVQFPIANCAMLRAVSGLVPAGQSDLNPDLNAVQMLLAVQGKIALFQNTPAAFHGRPEAAQELTAELRGAL